MRIFTSDGQRLAGFGASRRVWYPGRTHEAFACGTLNFIRLLAWTLVGQPFSTVWRLFHVAVFLPPRLLRIRYADVVHMLRELVRRDSLLGLAGTDHKAAHTERVCLLGKERARIEPFDVRICSDVLHRPLLPIEKWPNFAALCRVRGRC